MPLRLNVGFSRKIGEANFGSRGASVNLEVELDSSVVDSTDRLRERIQHLFSLTKASVDAELGKHNHTGAKTADNGHHDGVATPPRRDATRRATASQARALHVIADRQQVDLAELLRQRFGVEQADDLSITEASALIDELKGQTNGNGHGGKR